jgi:ADP-heptose:LPS heptosyltransferase
MFLSTKEGLVFESRCRQVVMTVPILFFIHLGASRGRSFVEEKLEKSIGLIRKYFPNHTLYITGSKEDQEKMITIKDDHVVPYFGKSMEEIMSLILGSSLYIGVDTGVTHIANMLSVKTLVLAEQGTSHWLPYYNPKATIVYSILESRDSIHEGREYLFSQAHGRTRYLDRIPLSVIEQYIQKASHEI